MNLQPGQGNAKFPIHKVNRKLRENQYRKPVKQNSGKPLPVIQFYTFKPMIINIRFENSGVQDVFLNILRMGNYITP